MLTVVMAVVSLHHSYQGQLIDKKDHDVQDEDSLFHPGSDPIEEPCFPAERALGTAPPK
jgi:hypothetical protein